MTHTEIVNAALEKVIIPDVSTQKREFFKAGVRELAKRLIQQIEEDKACKQS